MEAALFVSFATLAVLSAIVVVVHRNPLYSLLGLLSSLAATAVLFVMLAATWVAVSQVLIYALACFILLPASSVLFTAKHSPCDRQGRSLTRFSAALLVMAFATLLGALLGRAEGRLSNRLLSTGAGDIDLAIRHFGPGSYLLLAMLVLLVLVTAVGAHAVARLSDEQDR